MTTCTFRGGVHPDDGKSLSKNKAIQKYVPKGELVFPLSQHIGAPAVPVVEVGERVLAGQLIAKANGFVSANIHASVSGTVLKIEPRDTVNGQKEMAIVIENDMQDETMEFQPVDLTKGDCKQKIRDAIFQAGIVGMGGACFPTHVKATPKNEEAIEYIIVNGAECEPYLTSDYRRMLEEPEAVIGGLKLMLKVFEHAKGIIAIEDNKKDVIRNMKKLTEKEERIEVKKLRTKYPQGAERQLIYATTARKINSSMLPADAGCIVDNVDTIHAIYKAVQFGEPLTKRIVTVTGDAIKDPKNFLVPLGTNYQELIEAAGGFIKQPEKVISGGPMMGKALIQLNVPVVKGSSAILCMLKDMVSASEQTNCINCGKCVEVCPGRVAPSRLAKAAAKGDRETFLNLHGMECCECGCCSFICPAKRNLTQTIAAMRKDILAERKKKS